MKILILSELCSPIKYHGIEEERIKKILPSQQNYFWRLASSLSHLPDVSVDCISILPVSSSSHNKKIWRSETEIFNENLNLLYVGFINGKILKYITVPISVCSAVSRWFHENKDKEKYVICDVLQSVHIRSVFNIASRHNTDVVGVVTDLPAYITETVHTNYTYAKMLIQKKLDKISNETMQKYDKYIFLTEYMNDLINSKNKKHTIIEGIAPDEDIDDNVKTPHSDKKIVIYAGGVYEKYGIVPEDDSSLARARGEALYLLFYKVKTEIAFKKIYDLSRLPWTQFSRKLEDEPRLDCVRYDAYVLGRMEINTARGFISEVAGYEE